LFRKSATILMNEIFSMVLHNGYDFLMDGTFGSPKAIENLKRAVKHGFAVQLIYVLQDPKRAWDFTKAREKVEHRSIKFEGFIETYFKIAQNIDALKNIDTDIAIDLVTKRHDNGIDRWDSGIELNELDDRIKFSYNKEEIEKYVKGEL